MLGITSTAGVTVDEKIVPEGLEAARTRPIPESITVNTARRASSAIRSPSRVPTTTIASQITCAGRWCEGFLGPAGDRAIASIERRAVTEEALSSGVSVRKIGDPVLTQDDLETKLESLGLGQFKLYQVTLRDLSTLTGLDYGSLTAADTMRTAVESLQAPAVRRIEGRSRLVAG